MNDKGRLPTTQDFDDARESLPSQFTPAEIVRGQSIPPVSPAALNLPERIGRYRIERVLGKGGFGLVYLAHDDELQRAVAIKVPNAGSITHPDDAASYLAEARTVAHLAHPHIVPVYDVGSTAECAYFVVSKFIDGQTLLQKIREARPSFREAAELLAVVAEALHYAHKQGIVHRDLKPGNILIDREGQPFVVDFGLALRERDTGSAHRYAGTPAYMSPEQARGEGHRVDGRSDVFSLGVILYELLTSRRPFHADTRHELLEEVASADPKPLRQIDDRVPRELERICLKALSKRASERYTTAKDLADDLRAFVGATPAGSTDPQPPKPDSRSEAAKDTALAAATRTTPPIPASDSRPLRIVPKGLRSFDAHDADFFLELLPGPCDRDGLPDSIRFWKTRIEETDADKTFSVGLICGPSGCGKSSLVKAGLLPRLSDGVIAVYVEATAEETETRLLNGLRKRCPALPVNIALQETLTALRRGQSLPVGKKVVLVLDQFEQWLHARQEEENTELVQALRQCDGSRVQCLVMVRDDFWMAVIRFMRELEVRLVDGQNSAAVDLFPIRHAEKVLAAFGRAYGALPDDSSAASPDQKQFLERAVSGLAQEGKVSCVRLALFAEMTKGKPWTPATLREVGGAEGVGVAFLEETFSAATAPPEHRYHQKAARAVLKALLPESGTDIKGHMRSHAELLEASGYASRPRNFDDLIRILDSEIRLITPTDPESADDGAAPAKATAGQKYYQLTHDYLVPSLRDWLTRKQRETRRGRAELRLAERAALWQAKPENRHLPSWWEYLAAVSLVPRTNRTAVQQKMLRKAGRVHAVRWGSAVAVLLLIGLGIWSVVSTEREGSLRRQVATAVDAVQNNRGLAVPLTLRDLERLPREMILHELRTRFASAEASRKLGLAYALAAYDEVDAPFLCSQIEHSAPEEADNFAAAFAHARDASLEAIRALAEESESEQNWRLKARLAVVALHLGEDHLAADMCHIDQRPDPIQRTIFIDELPAWHGDVAKLAANCRSLSDPGLRSALCMAIGSLSSDRLAATDKDAWKPLFTEWFQSAPDNVTHSAAGWAQRQWQIELPGVSGPSQPSANHERFVNSLGMTLLKIHAGKFIRVDENSNSKPQYVTLTRPYFLSDREASVDQFQKFIDDPGCPNADKPADWQQGGGGAGDHPVQGVNWYDAVLFCNWLSRKEGLAACYERTGKKEKGGYDEKQEFDAWQLAPSGTGYRLPTEAEWEYACRAGTSTDFSCGTDEELLRKYAVYATGTTQGAAACGSRLPNGRGLFDMHGNVFERCHDFYGDYGDGDISDPVGPSQASVGPGASDRVIRGGGWFNDAASCRSGYRGRDLPVSRFDFFGFRVALSSGRSSK